MTILTTPTRSEELRQPRAQRRPVRSGSADPKSEPPGAPRTPPRDAEPTPVPLPRNLVGVKVLVVDDDASTLDFLAAALGYCGATVTTALTAADALAVVQQARPDVVLSDIAMPGHDGYWLIREIRGLADPALRGVPVVATTAYGREHSRGRTLAAGFVAHVSKPVDPDVLCRTIARAMGR
jgi:CheY-like chemotaxis protein